MSVKKPQSGLFELENTANIWKKLNRIWKTHQSIRIIPAIL